MAQNRDFSSNFTARYKVNYQANNGQHSFMLRVPSAENLDGPFIGRVNDFLASLAISGQLVTDWSVLGALAADNLVDVFLPATPPVFGNNAGTTGPANSLRPNFMSFVGRSTGGSRVTLKVFGWGVSAQSGAGTANYRVTGQEAAWVNTTIAALNAIGAVGIDGLPVLWYPYVNYGVHAGYQRKLRRG